MEYLDFSTIWYIVIALATIALIIIRVIARKTGKDTSIEEETINGVIDYAQEQTKQARPIHINDTQLVNEHSDFRIIGTVKKPEEVKAQYDTEKLEEEAKSVEQKPKRGRPRKVPLAMLLILILFGASSCSITDAIGVAKQVGITWSPDDSSDKQAIDSVHIISKPVYWKEPIDTLNFEKEFIQDGYKVWILQAGGVRRVEVLRLDTVMKVYRK